MNYPYLIAFYIVTYYNGVALSADKYSPRITKCYVYNSAGIQLTFGPPEESRNSSLENYFVKWKNSTDAQYKSSFKVSKEKATIVKGESQNFTIYASEFLTYHENQIKPCSSFDIEVSAVFNDLTSTFDNTTAKTGTPIGPVLNNIFCTSNSSNELEVTFDPSPQDYYSACNFSYSYSVRAEGFSEWNDDKEEIPKFETSESFVLSGLSPNTEYHVYVTEKLTSQIKECKATTLVEGPSPVILNEVYSSSPSSIFASWSPPAKPYGAIKKYWIEAFETKNLSKNVMMEVQRQFNRVIIQKLTPKSEYKIAVWAENEAGMGERSKEVTINTT